jgi:hypothetical protein
MLRISVLLALVATFAASAVPVGAHPTIDVANPSPNDRLTPGALKMSGVAFDADATQGTGVDHVSIFLGSRDHGGLFLGDATLGRSSAMPAASAQSASAGWIVQTPAIKGAGEQRTLYVYAHSTVTDTETVLKVPVIIGHQPPAPPSPSLDAGGLDE